MAAEQPAWSLLLSPNALPIASESTRAFSPRTSADIGSVGIHADFPMLTISRSVRGRSRPAAATLWAVDRSSARFAPRAAPSEIRVGDYSHVHGRWAFRLRGGWLGGVLVGPETVPARRWGGRSASGVTHAFPGSPSGALPGSG